jgi:hypothetical protein
VHASELNERDYNIQMLSHSSANAWKLEMCVYKNGDTLEKLGGRVTSTPKDTINFNTQKLEK